MITRRRGHCNTALMSLEVEVSSAVNTIEDLSSFPEEFPARDIEKTGMELEDILGMEDFEWNLEPTSPIFDVELADLYSGESQNCGAKVTIASPDSVSSTLKIRNKQRQANQVINKNAIAARLNRLKKKEYVDSLEKQVGIMSTENSTLKTENSHLTKRVEELEDETRAPTQTITTTLCHGNV
ncbi:CREB/ATF bZIP transcription factor [Corythoichthys intestinalis]|uniref:CREB/ATF bZIP transcription factor n=1 Tax=Corythoichthys intestinalis TaxID=161448 RepID=UPI0025A6864F|nr:CREB/ATF bZIP transcription factor [Corythoichthys intestinalis]